jgi:hypothetical protein
VYWTGRWERLHRLNILAAEVVFLDVPVMSIAALDGHDRRRFVGLFGLLLNSDAFGNGVRDNRDHKGRNSQASDQHADTMAPCVSMTLHLQAPKPTESKTIHD